MAIIFAMVALRFGVSAGQGYVPGIEPTDQDLPAKKPDAGPAPQDEGPRVGLVWAARLPVHPTTFRGSTF